MCKGHRTERIRQDMKEKVSETSKTVNIPHYKVEIEDTFFG